MEYIGVFIAIISIIASIIDGQNKKKDKAGKKQVPDWKKLFGEIPSKLPVNIPKESVSGPEQKPLASTTLTPGVEQIEDTVKQPRVKGQTLESTTSPTITTSYEFIDWDKETSSSQNGEGTGPVVVSVSVKSSGEDDDIFADLQNPEVLRKAMLVKEILGRPRALDQRRHR